MLTDRQRLRMADLPEGYRVVGLDLGAFVVRNPNGQILLIQQDGHLTGVTTRRNLTAHHVKHAGRLGVGTATTHYTSVMD
jgi:hypothetical protein